MDRMKTWSATSQQDLQHRYKDAEVIKGSKLCYRSQN